jgi:hypothetical protein
MTQSMKSSPHGEWDRAAIVECANTVFDAVMARFELPNAEAIRSLWNADDHVDGLLEADKPTMDRDYALRLTEAIVVNHIATFASRADLGRCDGRP